MTSDLCSSPMSLLFTFVQKCRFHLYSWLQQPLRDGYHHKNNFQHPPQQYSLAIFKDVTVQAHNLIFLNVKLCSMFNIFTRFNSSSNPPKNSPLHNMNTHWPPRQRFRQQAFAQFCHEIRSQDNTFHNVKASWEKQNGKQSYVLICQIQ